MTIRERLLQADLASGSSAFFSTVGSSAPPLVLTEFLCYSTRFAGALSGWEAATEQERIGVLSENNPELLFFCVGGWLTGRFVPVLLSYRNPIDEVVRLLVVSGCRRILVSELLWPRFGHVLQAQLPSIPCLPLQHFHSASNDEIGDSWRHKLDSFPLRSDHLAAILHTSGTSTGHCKLISLTHGNVVSNQDACLPRLRCFWTAATHTLAWLPLYHGFGLISEFLHNIWTGARTTLFVPSDPFSMPTPHELLRALTTSKATAICCVPWMLEQFAELVSQLPYHQNQPEETPFTSISALTILRDLQFCLVGGAPLSPSVSSFFIQHHVPILSVLGITELSGSVMFSSLANPSTLNLVDGLGGCFHLVGTSSNTHQLVFKRDDALSLFGDAMVDGEGFFCTGDLFAAHDRSEGWLSAGRLDAVFKTSTGIAVNPEQIEQRLQSEGSIIRRAAVYGQSDLDHLYLCAELAATTHSPSELWRQVQLVNSASTFAIPQCGVYLLPEGVIVPRTAKGSIDRKALPALFQLLRASHPPLSVLLTNETKNGTDDVLALVIQALASAQVAITESSQCKLPLTALASSCQTNPEPLAPSDAEHFLRQILNVDWSSSAVFESGHRRLKLLTDVCRKFVNAVPFQSLLTVADTRPIKAKRLPDPGEIRKLAFDRQGGQCFVMNVFFGQLLASMGFTVEYGRTTIHNMMDAHVTLLIRSLVELDDLWNVDVGCGFVLPEPIRLDSIEDESPIYRFGSFRVKYVRRGERWWRLHDCNSVETASEMDFICNEGLRWHRFWQMSATPQPPPSDESEEARLYLCANKIRASVVTHNGTMLYFKVDPPVCGRPATCRKIVDRIGVGLIFEPIASRKQLEMELKLHFPSIEVETIGRALAAVGLERSPTNDEEDIK